jgi:hypothetical protein
MELHGLQHSSLLIFPALRLRHEVGPDYCDQAGFLDDRW